MPSEWVSATRVWEEKGRVTVFRSHTLLEIGLDADEEGTEGLNVHVHPDILSTASPCFGFQTQPHSTPLLLFDTPLIDKSHSVPSACQPAQLLATICP